MSMRGRRVVLSVVLIAIGLGFFEIGGDVQAWVGAAFILAAVLIGFRSDGDDLDGYRQPPLDWEPPDGPPSE